MHVRLANSERILARSAGAVFEKAWLHDGCVPVKGGLLDEEIFGPHRPLCCSCSTPPRTLVQLGKPCDVCGVEAMVNDDLPWGRFGHIALPNPVPHPLAHGLLARFLDMPLSDVTALALGSKVLMHAATGTIELLDEQVFQARWLERPETQALGNGDALLYLAERRAADPSARAELGDLSPQDLFLLAVPVLPTAARQIHAPFRSADVFNNVLLFHTERHTHMRNLPPDLQRLNGSQIAIAVFKLFDNARAPIPNLDVKTKQPAHSLRAHLERVVERPLSFDFERGQQSLEIDDTLHTRALLEALALEILPDPRWRQN